MRHPDHRLHLQLRPRARTSVDLVGEVRHPTGDPVLSAIRRRPLRPPPRHQLLDEGHVGRLGRVGRPLARADRSGRGDQLPVLRHGQRLPVPPEGAGDRGTRPVPRRGVLHEHLAARGCRLHRQAGRRDRHRIVGHPVDPADRRAGRPAHRLPAHGELLDTGAERAAVTGATRRARDGQGRLPRGGQAVAGRCPDRGHRDRRRLGDRRGAARALRGGLGGGGAARDPRCVQRPPVEPDLQ